MAAKERYSGLVDEDSPTPAQLAAIAQAMREIIHKSNEGLRRYVHREAARAAVRAVSERVARMPQSNL